METCRVARFQVRIRRGTGTIPQRIHYVCSDPDHSAYRSTRKLSGGVFLPCVRDHQQSSRGLGQLPHERRSGFQGKSEGNRTYPEIHFLQLYRLGGPSPKTTHTVGIHDISLYPTVDVEF